MSKFKGLMFVAVLALVGLSGCASYPTAPKAMSHAVNVANPDGVYGEVTGVMPQDEWMQTCIEYTAQLDVKYKAAGAPVNAAKATCHVNIPGFDWAIVMLTKSATKGDLVAAFKVPVELKVQKGDVLRFRMPTSNAAWQKSFMGIARRAAERDSTCPGFTGPPLHEQVVCNGFEAFRDFVPVVKRDEFWTKTDTELGFTTVQEEGDRGLEKMVYEQTGKRVKCSDKCVPVE